MNLAGWFVRHAQALLGSLGRLARSPLATVLTLLVIGVALALPLALNLLVTNARTATGDFSGAVELSVYLKREVSVDQARQLLERARERGDVAAVTLITAEEALAEFREHSGFGAALTALRDNPLPHLLSVQPGAAAGAAAGSTEQLRAWLAAWPEVELVQVDTEWVQRLDAILELIRRVLGLAAVLLGAGVLAIIGNTIRLEILNRRAEIEVTKLVGGSDGFVRRPFLYTGALYGLGGALLAWGIVIVAVAALAPPVARLAALYGSAFTLGGPTPEQGLLLLGAGLALGWLGAWLAAARHLRAIEPRA
jgi:cell division transport system permease protein